MSRPTEHRQHIRRSFRQKVATRLGKQYSDERNQRKQNFFRLSETTSKSNALYDVKLGGSLLLFPFKGVFLRIKSDEERYYITATDSTIQ